MDERTELNRAAQAISRSRMRIMHGYPFFGILLTKTKVFADDATNTACTDGKGIRFDYRFVNKLDDDGIDFLFLHEIMHIVLGHVWRREYRDVFLHNVACDIVVNSFVCELMDIKRYRLKGLGDIMHLTPSLDEGYKYTSEEVYEMLYEKCDKIYISGGDDGVGGKKRDEFGRPDGKNTDDHSKWGTLTAEETQRLKDEWDGRIKEARDLAEGLGDSGYSKVGGELIKRLIGETYDTTTDWREILQSFLQEDIYDYTFSPVDKRYGDSPFFMPDFNVCDNEEVVKNVWFVIDVSDSVSSEILTLAVSEVISAIRQYNGRLSGFFSYFSTVVTDPVPIETVNDVLNTRPYTTGGTDFAEIFNSLSKFKDGCMPSNIVIITDGVCEYPPKEAACDIPTLWLITTDIEPPWGAYVHIEK